MNRLKRWLSLILVYILIVTAVPINADAATVKLNRTKVTVYVGQTVSLKVKGTKGKVKWSSSNKKAATVSSKGKVTAKKKGTAKIIGKVGKKKLTCKVTVKNPYLNESNVSLEKGNTITLKLTGSKAKTWNSSNNDVATVDKTGKVTATGAGTATVKVKAANKKVYSCKVTVKEAAESSTPEPSHTHSYIGTITKAATCTEEGIRTYLCSCGASYTESIAKTSHSYEKTINTKVATCTENGENSATCTACGHIEKTSIPATGHKMIDGICEKCGYTEEEEHTHDYLGTVTKKASCLEEGETTYTCSCGASYTEPIKKTDHILSDWIVDKEATCTSTGSKHKECMVCKVNLQSENISATGHSIVDGVCSKCGYTEEEKHTHNYEIEVTEPTCTEQGYTTYACSCGDSFVSDYVDALGHEITDWTVVTEPTCTEFGWKEKKCSRCGYVEEGTTISATGHSYDEGTIKTEATCTTDGEKTYTCTVCGDVKTETIKAVGHTYGEFVETLVPANFETFGTADMVCPACGEHIFDNLTAVKVDIGNGESATMYGYYDYEEAKKCFDLTYEYKDANGFLYEGWEYKWDDTKYNFACIRVAEMACQYITSGTASHSRPGGGDIPGCENLTYRVPNFEAGNHSIFVSYSAEEAFQSWMNSNGHKDNIESGASDTALAKFTAWIPEWESWSIFWVQNFY